MINGKQWLGSIYDKKKYSKYSSELIQFPSEKNCFRCIECGAFLGSEGKVAQARLWKSEDGSTLLEIQVSNSHSDDTKLCYYSCWGCKRIISTTDNQTIFGTDQNWIPAKLDGVYVLAKCAFRILFCSLTLDEHAFCVDRLRLWAATHPSLNIIIETYDMPLASLRSGTSFSRLTNEIDLVIVAHLSEGRLLLTDADGFYNSFLAEACRATLGNAIILVTSDDVDESDYMDVSIVQELVECGQRSVEYLHRQKRILSCRNTLSAIQLDIIGSHCAHDTPPLEISCGTSTGHSGSRSEESQSHHHAFCELL